MGRELDRDDVLCRHRATLEFFARLQIPYWLQGILDAEDLVQQTLLEVEKGRERLAALPETECLAVLRRSLTNNLIDAIRKHQPERDRARTEASSARLESWLVADHSTPLDRAARSEKCRLLAECLAALPPEQRRAVELKHLHGRNVREIALVMNKSLEAVGGLLRRGMERLRERMKTVAGDSHG